MTTGRVEVTAADIARIADVKPTAVSNWRKRHDDFPRPVGGTDRSPRFDLGQVEAWLRQQGKAQRIPVAERLWQTFESVRGSSAAEDALALTGVLLLHLRLHPEEPIPRDKTGFGQLMERAEHTFAHVPGGAVGSLGQLVTPLQYDLGARQLSLLTAAAETAAAEGAEETFGQLCERFLAQGPRSGFAATPRELADLMVALVGPPATGTVLDSSCGSGTFLLAAAEAGSRRVQGQELNHSLAMLAALRLAFRNADRGDTAPVSFDIQTGDTLRRPAFPRGRAGAAVGHPPFADRNWGYEDLTADPSWEYGIPPRGESELAWVQHTLAHTAPGASVALLLPPAVGSRPSGRRIRVELLRRGALRAVISLPAGYAAHYALALQIWVLRHPSVDDPDPERLLVVDASAETDPRELIAGIWSEYAADPGSFTPRPGVARAVPLLDLLEDADVTPRRHLPQPTAPGVSLAALSATRSAVEDHLKALLSRLPSVPELPELTEIERAGIRTVSLGELAKSGAVVLRRSAPAGGSRTSEGPPGPGEARFVTARDVVEGRPASESGPAPEDPLQHQPVRAGDILLPVVTQTVVARVATNEDAGAYPAPTLHQIRVTDTELLDPWFVAGYLSSSEGGHQAASASSSLGLHTRVDPRRVRVPLLPIERQRVYGEAFRTIAEFTRALRAAHDLGQDLARNSTDAVAAALRGADADDAVPLSL
ncbi:N-6 DNA methylase [Streptomyces tendae]|uniref:N-6 DNA methylase n=1 Tax=Streptomyces tendae TaxID=1932 RepID=A0A6B3QBI1_STRTE|nr:N-6 DNA methylase [Streptomyces tendae]NEV85428.1 N-6 DNA methylase [Streptomyces tendae]